MIFTLGIIAGFLFWKFFAGKYEGDKIGRSWRPLIGNYYIHIHHWLWCSVLLLLLLLLNYYTQFIVGLLAGSIVQGLFYRDRFVIMYHKDMFEKIYNKFRQVDNMSQENDPSNKK